jgi:isopentenyl-diphosphate Delta-isomerase
MEQIILVDEQDRETGTIEKLEAHRRGLLHRAISVLVFNSKGELLLQQRALGKYHSAGLWANTCCSHPAAGEATAAAAARRLMQEMGLRCPLTERFSFVYKADVGNGLTEYEYDHVFTGVTDDIPQPAPDEVAAWKYMSLTAIEQDMKAFPGHYAYWFRICMEEKRHLL